MLVQLQEIWQKIIGEDTTNGDKKSKSVSYSN